MPVDPQQKLEALQAELQQISQNYQEAKNVVQNCERKIFELKGGILACEDILKAMSVMSIAVLLLIIGLSPLYVTLGIMQRQILEKSN